MSHLSRLIREIHRRSLWQVLGIYLAGGWVGLQLVDILVDSLGLPQWLPVLAIVLIALGIPLVLATAFVQKGGPVGRRDPTLLPDTGLDGGEMGAAQPVESGGVRRLFTWRNAMVGGVMALAVWSVAAGWLLMRGRSDSGREEAVAEVDVNVVAVLPFRVTGPDELAYLGEGMVDLLAAVLIGEGGPRAADPRSVLSAWRRAAGAEGDEVPREAAVEVARSLGAGRVLLGSIVGPPSGLVVNASLISVHDGEQQAQARAEGPLDSLTALVDQLTARLLALEAGETEQRLAALTSTSMTALRAYLDGQAAYRRGSYEQSVRHFEHALQADSTFALAALGLVSSSLWSEGAGSGVYALAMAWPLRDRLSKGDRALLEALAGPRYPGASTTFEQLEMWDRAIEAVPERAEPWYEVGEVYFHQGSWLGFESPLERAAAHFDRALQLDSTFAAPLGHLLEISAMQGDTGAVRALAGAYLALDSVGDLTDFYRWQAAHALGDSATAARLRGRFSQFTRSSLLRIVGLSQLHGFALEDARLAAAELAGRTGVPQQRSEWLGMLHDLAMNRGHPTRALELTHEMGIGRRWTRITDALYWGGDAAAAAEAVDELATSADAPLDVGAEAFRFWDTPIQIFDICNVEGWRLWHGETGTAQRAIDRIEIAMRKDGLDSGNLVAEYCVAELEAILWVHQNRPDAGEAIRRLDSLVVAQPFLRWGSLVVARLREDGGDLPGALTALRRRLNNWNFGVAFLSTYLREEGRLAALTGDTEGAIRAYRHYLALRSDPEPAVVPEVELVRAELERLLGEAGR
jgi:serine/threonine-protein kinase